MNRKTLVVGIDIAKPDSLAALVRAEDRARVGKLRIPTTAEGVLQVANFHRRGRPRLRRFAHQAAVAVVLHHPGFQARFLALTKRQNRPLQSQQAGRPGLPQKLVRGLQGSSRNLAMWSTEGDWTPSSLVTRQPSS